MIPYSQSLMLNNPSNFEIVKTETLLEISPNKYMNHSYNASESVEWILSPERFERSLKTSSGKTTPVRKLKPKKQAKSAPTKTKHIKKKKKKFLKKKKLKRKGKVKKCIFKILKKGDAKRRNRRKQGKFKHKKYIAPVLIGLLAAKSLLVPVALKALAFISAKGLMMGFFSTIIASILSLKHAFDRPHYHERKDEGKTQVEIIQVPTKSEDHIYYDDHYGRRNFYTDNGEHFRRHDNEKHINENAKHDFENFGNNFNFGRHDFVPIAGENQLRREDNVIDEYDNFKFSPQFNDQFLLDDKYLPENDIFQEKTDFKPQLNENNLIDYNIIEINNQQKDIQSQNYSQLKGKVKSDQQKIMSTDNQHEKKNRKILNYRRQNENRKRR